MAETNLKFKLLDSIGNVYERSRKCKLQPGFFNEIDKELELLSGYFKVSKTQAFFVAVVMAMNYKGELADFNELIEYFRCNPMTILKYSDDFEMLCEKGYLRKEKSLHRLQQALANDQYSVNEEVTQAILLSKPIPDIAEKQPEEILEVLGKLFNLAEQRQRENISTRDLFFKTRIVIHSNLHFPLIKKISDFQLHTADNYLYLYLVWQAALSEESVDIGKATSEIYDDPVKKVNYLQKILSGDNALLKNNLVEVVEAKFFNDTALKLTDQSHQLINDCGVKIKRNHINRNNIIEPFSVLSRKLIFSKEMESRLSLIKNVLIEENLATTQKRLSSKKLPMGITVLFHGEPGTGKTELVFQLAKETNRRIFKIDISQSKSLWYGESEKIIKRIFTDYSVFLKECKQVPILLFNEADAIFSARRELRASNVSQTENAVQNIILDELERFEGVLMATTNLTGNFDAAFNRRFLFKVRFQKPDLISKEKIWKLKFPELDTTENEMLASRFDFTGAQIDNILRKSEMHEIIYGKPVNFHSIVDYCQEENQLTKLTKIGFSKS